MSFSSRVRKLSNKKFLPAALLSIFLTGCIDTVPFVDVNRYLGTWYEIGGYQTFFNKGLVGTTATYELLGDGTISVYNRAFKESCDGEESTISGYAIADDETNSKLSVKLEVSPGFFTDGKYWVIGLDEENYEYAVVSDPSMQSLFILNRKPEMAPELLNSIIEQLVAAGYDEQRILMTPQCA